MSKSITLSANTLGILKVASQINNAVLFRAGNEIKATTESGIIILQATIDEEWPRDFAILELNRLLQVLNQSAMTGAALHFEDGKECVEIKASRSRVRYNFSDMEMVTSVDRTIVVEPNDVNLSFDLNEQTLNDVRKMAGVLAHSHLRIECKDNTIKLITYDPKLDDLSNEYTTEIEVPEGANFADGTFNIKLENMILLPGSHKVSIFKGVAAEFAHQTVKASIFMGLEKM
ncbi:hypothetical protein SHAb15599_00003 [Acinetobacter phage SH-Ab 15599]|nr:hypothetical protein SHAb15599_00003 [Acinetobacter phage SH-Ab 15599]